VLIRKLDKFSDFFMGSITVAPVVWPPSAALRTAAWRRPLGSSKCERSHGCENMNGNGTITHPTDQSSRKGEPAWPYLGSTAVIPPEPPPRITYDLEEALELLAALEDALEIVAETDYLGVVAEVENEVARLHRKLGFDHPAGGEDGR
jgi:hypothetical protein